ncbi:MAG: hypothetical protein ACT4NL_14870 [Pseudomarimonas sp.]
MTDDALKRAYRQLTARQSTLGRLTPDGNASATGDSLAALVHGGYTEAERDAHLAAVAESAQNADLLRALRSLAGDANQLSANVEKLNGQTRTRPTPAQRQSMRPARWYALAASVAMAGVVGLVMQPPVSIQSLPSDAVSTVASGASSVLDTSSVADGGKIMMASFDDTPANVGEGANKPTIFVGDFDS